MNKIKELQGANMDIDLMWSLQGKWKKFFLLLTMTLQAMAANEDLINSEMAAEE